MWIQFSKLWQLGFQNQIIDDLDSKLSEFRFRLKEDVDFWIKSTNFWLKWIKFDQFFIKFDHFLNELIKMSRKMTLMSIKRSKMVKFNQKSQSIYIHFFNYIQPFLIYFQSPLINFEHLNSIRIQFNRFRHTNGIRSQYSDQICWLNEDLNPIPDKI